MTITTGQLTVGITPTEIDGISPVACRIHVHNMDNTNDIYLGNGDVSSTTGLRLMRGDSIELVLNPGEALHAVVGSGTAPMSYLKQVY
jgi:hypothetical protein